MLPVISRSRSTEIPTYTIEPRADVSTGLFTSVFRCKVGIRINPAKRPSNSYFATEKFHFIKASIAFLARA
jgi:hypothetical protein